MTNTKKKRRTKKRKKMGKIQPEEIKNKEFSEKKK